MPTAREPELYPHEGLPGGGQSEQHHLFVSQLLDYLRVALRDEAETRVVADHPLYFAEGDPTRVAVPDISVYIGAGRRMRRVWKVWEEGGKVPDLVVEVLGDPSLESAGARRTLYGALGVREYLVLDPDRLCFAEGIRAYRLDGGELERIRAVNWRVLLDTVGMWVGVEEDRPRAWTRAGAPLLSVEELAARLEARDRDNAALRAELARARG